jgi:hypothetical protein
VIAVEWEQINLAGSFFIGALFGTIVTLRIVKYITHYFLTVPPRADHDDDEEP